MKPETPIVDLRSDTVTRPTPEMRKAISRAHVGDDVFGEDPTVNELQRRAADLFGKESALLVPSGTMANLLAIVSQTHPGDSVLLSEDAHIYHYESGGCSMFAGVMPRLVATQAGILTADLVRGNLELSNDPHCSSTTLVAIENTMNRGGGAVYDLKTIQEIGELKEELGFRLHCDGARIFNASVATGVDVRDFAAPCNTISFCLSKGLGCPIGSLLLGDRATISRAHRYRKMVGGGMRQAGIIAAAGIYALDHHIDRLAEDHSRARKFRKALERNRAFSFPLPTPTNIVVIEHDDASSFVQGLSERGVLCFDVAPNRIRVVFHLDVDDEGLDLAIQGFRQTAKD